MKQFSYILISFLIFINIFFNCANPTTTNNNKNTPPHAMFTILPVKGPTPFLFELNASLSWDLEDSLSQLEVRWDWENDGTWDTDYSNEKFIYHQYQDTTQIYTKLEVRDSYGLVDSSIKGVTLKDEPNIINIDYKDNQFFITWRKSVRGDFKEYSLFQSDLIDMTNETLIYKSELVDDTSFTVTGIEKNVYKYYRIGYQYFNGTYSIGLIATASSHDRIIFSGHYKGEYGIYSVDINGNWPYKISAHGLKPNASLDGSKIVFISGYGENYHIYTVNTDGSNEQFIAKNMSWNGFPEFNFDGSKIVSVIKENNSHIIYSMKSDGTNNICLTGGDTFNPHFSADGSKIVYHFRSAGWDDIYLMNSDGGNKVNLTNLGVTGSPEISPNGNQIIFIAQLSHDYEMYSINIDGSNFQNISNQQGEEADAKFSPDGDKIVFIKFTGNINDLYIMDNNGSNKKILSSGGSNRFPRFSPDGSKIVFWSDRNNNKSEIYLINIDGTGLKCVSNHFSNPQYPNYLYVD